ncbi:MAG: SMODS domain-containing nucleotidyltransferase [Candidatus Cryptobacteroides sp.]|jgi:hypothetical protein
MKLEKAIEKFIENITVTDKQETVIEGAFNNVKNYLTDSDSSLSVKEVFLNGSYVRDTMIRPLDDIDIFAVIDKSDYSDNGNKPNPQSVLTKFRNYLNETTDYKDKVSQDRPCVTITLDKLKIDILPALRETGNLYIPNENLNGWTFSDPKSHTEKLDQVNDRRNGKVKDVVKAVKSWKKQNDYKIPSFHIEEIAMEIFNSFSFDTFEEGIRKWFDRAFFYIEKDKFNSDKQYKTVLDAINSTAVQINKAKSKKDNKDEAEAIKIWHDIFGRDFPTISEEEAKRMSDLLTSGNLKYGAATGLSSVSGHEVAASKGFYGEE